MRRKIIAGNWKMNKTVGEAVALVQTLKDKLVDVRKVELVVCPPFVALQAVGKVIAGTQMKLGAQNLHWEAKGAFTGEVSGEMLKAVGCEFVIIGHSERRQFFNESDELINKKLKRALQCRLTPIVCVGETLKQREEGLTVGVVENQLRSCLKDLTAIEPEKLVIAYEPVWAIGTGRNATPEQANEVHQFIRELLKKLYNDGIANKWRIQYGGSVNPENASALLSQKDIDGALVGGASLKADSFMDIVKAGELFSS